MADDVAATLDSAANLIERDGWTQGNAHGIDGGHCVLGAIALVTGFHEVVSHIDGHLPAVRSNYAHGRAMDRAARTFVRFISQDGIGNIPKWNDAEHRTAEEVVKTMRAAAEQGKP